MRTLSARQLRRNLARVAPRVQAAPPLIRKLGAPVGGLNGRDAWEDMDPLDAIRLDNFLPSFGRCSVRPGSSEFAQVGSSGFTPETSPVETLAVLNLSSGAKMIAAADDSIWDVSTTGDKDTALASSLGNARWQHVNMNDVLGLVNGEDVPKTYNGTAIANMTVSGSGLTTTNLIGIHVYKHRSYFVEANSQSFWYSAVNTLGGTLTEFNLGDVGTFGGHLAAITSWSRDAGAGMDDLIVFLMSSGDTIVYSGSDPGDSDDWAQVGVYRIGAPIGRRCAEKIGGETVVLTSDGPVSLSRVLPGGRVARDVDVSNKLGKLLTDEVALNSASFGWQPFLFPREKFALINYPTGGQFEQFAVNIQTGAWCRLKGWDASCWALFDDVPYFGTSTGRVMKAWTGVQDDGVDVIAEARQAFNYLAGENTQVQVKMVSPLLEAAAAVPLRVSLAADFADRAQASVDVEVGVAGGISTPWSSPWGSPWSTPAKTVQAWFAHSARGYAISPQIRIEQTDKRISWNATRFVLERAGVI